MPCVRTVVFRLCCENFRFSREATIRCCVRPAVPVGILQPPPAALMHGSRGSGLALARSARQTGKVGDQPESKSDTATRDTAIATSSGMRVLYHKSQSRCGGISGSGGYRAIRRRKATPARWQPPPSPQCSGRSRTGASEKLAQEGLRGNRNRIAVGERVGSCVRKVAHNLESMRSAGGLLHRYKCR